MILMLCHGVKIIIAVCCRQISASPGNPRLSHQRAPTTTLLLLEEEVQELSSLALWLGGLALRIISLLPADLPFSRRIPAYPRLSHSGHELLHSQELGLPALRPSGFALNMRILIPAYLRSSRPAFSSTCCACRFK